MFEPPALYWLAPTVVPSYNNNIVLNLILCAALLGVAFIGVVSAVIKYTIIFVIIGINQQTVRILGVSAFGLLAVSPVGCVLSIVTGALAVAAYRWETRGLIMSVMVLSVVNAVMSVVQVWSCVYLIVYFYWLNCFNNVCTVTGVCYFCEYLNCVIAVIMFLVCVVKSIVCCRAICCGGIVSEPYVPKEYVKSRYGGVLFPVAYLSRGEFPQPKSRRRGGDGQNHADDDEENEDAANAGPKSPVPKSPVKLPPALFTTPPPSPHIERLPRHLSSTAT